LVIESGALSAEHVLNVVARLNANAPPQSVETTLELQEAPVANTARYDSLRGMLAASEPVRAAPASPVVTNTAEVNHAA